MLSRIRHFIPLCGLLITIIINSGEALRCYQCRSHARVDDECRGDIITKQGDMHLVNCSLGMMNKWHDDLSKDNALHKIAPIFHVDSPANYAYQNHNSVSTPMACAKIDLKVDSEHMTLRTCQSAKTSSLDPCVIIQEQLQKDYAKSITVEFCGLCEKDNCNGAGMETATYIGTFVSILVTVLMGHARAV